MIEETRDVPTDPNTEEPHEEILRRATAVNMRCTEEHRNGRRIIELELPNGKGSSRKLSFPHESAIRLARCQFETLTALGNYEAILNSSTGQIEAGIESSGPFPLIMRLARLPEARTVYPEQEQLFEFEGEDEIAPEEPPTGRADVPREWVIELAISEPEITLEISRPTPEFETLDPIRFQRGWGRRPTFKIRGLSPRGHDEALRRLEDISASFFFELDLKKDVTLKLSKARPSRPSVRMRRTWQAEPGPLTVPRRRYSNEAVSLYTYGRSALGMPLLRFLAFYQCIEYYFPQHWNAEVIARVRRELTDPRFNPDEDPHIGRILQLAGARGKGGANEREQLRTTIESCMTSDDLRDFIHDNEHALDELLLRKGGIRGLTSISLNDKENKLTNQVANRIYDLRNRVVHAKEDGGPNLGVEVLLPFSAEADRLGADIALAQFVAQKVVIADRRGTLW